MIIQGLQKLTLLDYPGRVACTVFTAGCNLRCPFCHNAGLVTHIDRSNIISEEELFSFLKKRQGILDGVCVSGGEPLLMPDIIPFIEKIKSFGFLVKLDTNGTFFERLREIVEKGIVDYVAMDIKNSPQKYPMTAGCESVDIDSVKKSVALLEENGIDHEFRTTVVRELHTEEDMKEIGKWLSGTKKYFLQGFIDSGDLIGQNYSAYSPAEMAKMLDIIRLSVPSASLRGID